MSRRGSQFHQHLSGVPLALRRSARGFTRVDVLVALAVVLLLLVVVVAPALANTRSDPGRIGCFNNLRLIGRAVQSWTSDHGQQYPWRTYVQDGGTRQPNMRPANVFFDWAIFSNELATARILACPSDTGVRVARHFGFESDGGLLNVQYRNNAVSYPLHLDGIITDSKAWLTGDRNFRADFNSSSSCSSGVNAPGAIYGWPPEASFLAWTNNVHGAMGHVLTADGSVEFTSTARLREIILRPGRDDNGQTHFLKTR